jgi:hypothetical protein
MQMGDIDESASVYKGIELGDGTEIILAEGANFNFSRGNVYITDGTVLVKVPKQRSHQEEPKPE